MNTRIIGIDLAVTAHHQAAILDPATQQFVVKRMSVGTSPEELDHLLDRARGGAAPELIAILEATSMAWQPVSLYLQNHGARVYRVNGRMTQEMRRVRTPHARSDGLDCQALATLYGACPERLDPLYLPSGEEMTLQRGCREFALWREELTAIDNRLTSLDQWIWQGWLKRAPARALPWIRREWYDPWAVVEAGPATLQDAWRTTSGHTEEDAAWIQPWVTQATSLTRLFGSPDALDIGAISASIHRQLAQQAHTRQAQQTLFETVIAPLYHRLFPDCQLTSIYGIGEPSAAMYRAFIHTVDRFPNVDSFRQWTGMVPTSDQSGSAQSKGQHISQSGPNLIKATLFLNANVARQWDPQLAAVYHTQMVRYGKHHTQAVCACASHLANRIYAVLKENRPYVLRDCDGLPIRPADAHRLIQEHFAVPDDVRRRTSKRRRRQLALAPAQ